MDANRFDALARGFGSRMGRRRLLRLLGVGAASLPAVPARRAAAGTFCIADGDACGDLCGAGNPCNACCNGFCAAYGGCTDIGFLGRGQVCNLGTPNQCQSGFTCCPFRPGQRHGQGTCQDVCY